VALHGQGFLDRGTLEPGMRADINVFDLEGRGNHERLDVLPPSYATDLPLGAGRWVQGVVGYELTLCHGEPHGRALHGQTTRARSHTHH
jgi:N-acyl-D-amino-acid deacylase